MKRNLYSIIAVISVFLLSGCTMNSGTKPAAKSAPTSSIMKSTDGGATWEAKNKTDSKVNLSSIDILSLAINPKDGKDIFVGTMKNGILKSTDGGENWNLLNYPPTKVYGLAIDNAETSTIYATGVYNGYGKIFKSTDGGDNWDEVYTSPSDGPIVISLAADRSSAGTIYATVSDNQVIKTVDGGHTWQNIFTATGPVIKLATDSGNRDLVYMLTLGGKIMRSADSGKTFTESSNDMDGINTFTVDPARSGTIYSGGKSGLYRSKNAGADWEKLRILSNPENFPIEAIAINPANSDEIIYGAKQAVYRSVDGGQSWASFQLDTKKDVNLIQYATMNQGDIFIGLRSK